MSSRGDFYLAEMDRIQRESEARIDRTLSQARELGAKVDELDRKQPDTDEQPDPEPLSNEEVERFRKFILGYAWTSAWRSVVERIDSGELTWREVAESRTSARADPEISAAYASISTLPSPTRTQLIDIGAAPPEQPGDEPDRGHQAYDAPASKRADDDRGAGAGVFYSFDDYD